MAKKKQIQMELLAPRPKDLLSVEKRMTADGFAMIAGVDEAGRGPLAGPVIAAAVILPCPFDLTLLPGLDDSKTLSEANLARLFPLIKQNALSCAVAVNNHRRIDQINILAASLEAMRKAIGKLREQPDCVLVDGNQPIPQMNIYQKTLVKGDSRSASVACASILAKVTRDKLMVRLDKKYPQYGFCRNKGYATKKHKVALSKHGPCSIHRKTFAPVKACTRGKQE